MNRNKSGKSIERHPSTSHPFDKWSDEWWASRPREMQARRCTARKSDGTNVRCKNPALKMQNVCRYHGGATKNSKAAANRRLGEALDRMARNLLGIADSAESEAVRLAAITRVLALGGITEKQALEVEHTIAPYERVLQGINFGESRAEARARRGDPPIDDDEVLDAEVVDDEDERDNDEEPAAWPRAKRNRHDAGTDDDTAPPSAYSGVEQYPGMPPGYLPEDVALERIAQSTRRPTGGTRSRSARIGR